MHLIELDPPVDFALAITELHQQGGIAFRKQAERINVPWETFRRWMNGSEPSHSNGQAICKLYVITFRRAPPARHVSRESLRGCNSTPQPATTRATSASSCSGRSSRE